MFKVFSRRSQQDLSSKVILRALDRSAERFVFPMLDNGFIYLAASRLSLFRSDHHWAMVFEIFGFSPRAGDPDLSISTIASKLHNRDKLSSYVSEEAYQAYLDKNPNNEMRTFWPISNHDWIDKDEPERVASRSRIRLRDEEIDAPDRTAYMSANIDIETDKPAVFELCRYLAHIRRDQVLATYAERRISIGPEMQKLMTLDEWHHPDLAGGQLPSQTETFRQLASVLEQGDPSLYTAPEVANNHWENWPEGGVL